MTVMTIPVGPQHPLLKEPISFQIDIVGEQLAHAGEGLADLLLVGEQRPRRLLDGP